MNTVSYVDAFDYPLTPAEIHRYLIGHALSPQQLRHFLDHSALVPRRIGRSGDYYTLPGREAVVDVRRRRERVSARLWPEAVRYGLLLARMPFVRLVAVTGSLAVNNVGSDEDIDYFIVTADGHLWVCRAFVILIVRQAARRGIRLCPNYFLTERSLRLADRNLYTAHEVTQMVPLYGLPVYATLRRLNPWIHDFLPNAGSPPPPPAAARGPLRQLGRLPGRQLLEAALDTPPGRRLNSWEMGRKIRKFQAAYSGWGESEFTADCCKGHFNLHQQRAIAAYERRVSESLAPESETGAPALSMMP